MAFPTGWNRRCALTIDHTKCGASNSSSFPVLLTEVDFPSEALGTGSNCALNGGGDLRFSSDAAGASQLACEVVSFVTNVVPASGTAEVYVNVPTLSSSADTVIYVWYNNAGQSQPAAGAAFGSQAVWDSNFKAVYHLSALTDSTSNANDMTATGSPTTAAGKWGGLGYSFNGSSQYLEKTTSVLGLPVASTLEAWIFPTTVGSAANYTSVSLTKAGTDTDYWTMQIQDVNHRALCRDDASTINNTGPGSATISTSTWYYTAMRTQSNGKIDGVYINAASDGSATTNTLTTCTHNRTTIGVHHGVAPYDNFFAGRIDEVRISNIERSTSYLTATYNNLNSPSTFVTVGTPASANSTSAFFALF